MTTESPLVLDRLEVIAIGATPGPRDCDGFSDFSDGVDYTDLTLYSGDNQGPVIAAGITSQEDAKFLVTFDRETVLALIVQQHAPVWPEAGGPVAVELDLDELEATADKATSGPRVYHGTYGDTVDITLHSRKILGPVIANKITILGDAVFFAAFDRMTVLELIAGVRTAREEAIDEDLRERMAALLRGTASALNGPPAELSAHSWHDLPELAAKAVERATEAEAATRRVRGVLENVPHDGSVSAELLRRALDGAK